MYIKYTEYAEETRGSNALDILGFFSGGDLYLVSYSPHGEGIATWRDHGSKVSRDVVTYYEKQYRLNNSGQLCEVKSIGLFTKVLHDIMVVDIIKVLGEYQCLKKY